MPPWLVLMHELGHVKQYYEGPAASRANMRTKASTGFFIHAG